MNDNNETQEKFEEKKFKDVTKILTESEEGVKQVNIAQMSEVLSCFCKEAYKWSGREVLDFINRYGRPK